MKSKHSEEAYEVQRRIELVENEMKSVGIPEQACSEVATWLSANAVSKGDSLTVGLMIQMLRSGCDTHTPTVVPLPVGAGEKLTVVDVVEVDPRAREAAAGVQSFLDHAAAIGAAMAQQENSAQGKCITISNWQRMRQARPVEYYVSSAGRGYSGVMRVDCDLSTGLPTLQATLMQYDNGRVRTYEESKLYIPRRLRRALFKDLVRNIANEISWTLAAYHPRYASALIYAAVTTVAERFEPKLAIWFLRAVCELGDKAEDFHERGLPYLRAVLARCEELWPGSAMKSAEAVTEAPVPSDTLARSRRGAASNPILRQLHVQRPRRSGVAAQ